MFDRDGVIKFQLHYTPGPPVDEKEIRDINAWRARLRAKKVLGRSPDRYDNVGFGNISKRLPPYDTPAFKQVFLVSGTQTGGMETLAAAQYAVVTECYPAENRLVSRGPIAPSSEAMTHGTLYNLDPSLRWVMHGHAPRVWRNAKRLGIPSTAASVAYGTPEMAAEVERLYKSGVLKKLPFFSMGGHEDGVMSFGRTAEEAGQAFLDVLARAEKCR